MLRVTHILEGQEYIHILCFDLGDQLFPVVGVEAELEVAKVSPLRSKGWIVLEAWLPEQLDHPLTPAVCKETRARQFPPCP